MSFSSRLSNGWEVARSSFGVLRQDKELLLFPVMSCLATIALLLVILSPIAWAPQFAHAVSNAFKKDGSADPQVKLVVGVAGFIYYFLNYFIIVYFNTALASCAILRFRGGDPTIKTGISAANSRLPQIFGWALLAATVGFILKSIEERSNLVARIILSIVGAAWAIVTFMVMPILAVEGLGPIAALKRSGSLIKEVWGEGLGGNFSLTLVGLVLFLPVLIFIPLAMMTVQLSVPLMVVALSAAAIYFFGTIAVMSALGQIFVAGLYLYATEKKVPNGFSPQLVENAFAKSSRR